MDDVATHVRLFKRARLLQKTKSYSESSGKVSQDLESLFFDAEVAMEDGQVCRDLVCTIHQEEINYLQVRTKLLASQPVTCCLPTSYVHFLLFRSQDVAELLLFLLLPKEEFRAQPPRTLVRELLVNMVLKPLLDLISDPDFINQNIVWLYKDLAIKPELFIMAVRHSESLEELQATRESISKEINFLRSNDSRVNGKLFFLTLLSSSS